ncbi:MAG: preprotein translocase subunit SecE [Candidatus Colwellbacteria bacterium]|jgi:preprotein translocase SecE subunit|nr:preprotein translocase subunit SecE [Candidatus Colwellbacteria bacterium]MCK9497292.1 preprotein translocase subunit SecE [Candidatus Colwellbacteria bacterium]MDD3752777.1 preprotein translocase subunit SecE [Candidatus Colwellbacteria bacterium]
MKSLNSFISGIVSEFKQVTWPSKKETIRLVIVVIAFSLLMSFFLGFADLGFRQLVQKFII